MNKKHLIGICICAMVFFILSSSVSSVNVTLQCNRENTPMHSYHMILKGQKFWKSIMFTFSEDAILYRHLSCRCSINDSNLNFIAELFQGGGAYYRWMVISPIIASPDRYFQYRLGPFYGFHSHDKKIEGWTSWTDIDICYGVNCKNLSYTFISYMNNSCYDIWLNWTGNATISEAEGTNVFAYDRHDFTGNINIGRKRGTFIVNGQKKISIDNQLVAWFFVENCLNGRETLRYKTPTGEEGWMSIVDKKGEHISWNNSIGFDNHLVWGSSGIWQFSINMFNIGLQKKTPNVYLIGADIRVP